MGPLAVGRLATLTVSHEVFLNRRSKAHHRLREASFMNSLDWLISCRLLSVVKQEYQWVFEFDDSSSLRVECLWRLLENGRIRLTSEDDGQQFGLPAPVLAAYEKSRRIVGSCVSSVALREGTLDLELRFQTSHVLQVVPTTAGYEAWNARHGDCLYVATGGGELAIFRGVRGENDPYTAQHQDHDGTVYPQSNRWPHRLNAE